MRINWVIDASVAVKLFLAEPESEVVRAQVDALGPALCAPSLLRYEVGNVLARSGLKDFDQHLRNGLATIAQHEPQGVSRHLKGLSYYDASYLALAIERKAGLWTYDRRLQKAARAASLETEPGRLP